MKKYLILGSVVAAGLSSASAALIHANGNVTLSSLSTIDSPAGLAAVSNGITGDIVNGEIYTDDPDGSTGSYFNTAPAIVFVLDLSQSYSIDAIAFFNRTGSEGGQGNGNAVKTFSAEFALDSDFTAGYYDAGSFGAAANDQQQDFALGAAVDAQYVRITISENYAGGDVGTGGDRVGFNEFQFNAVPEPSTMALLGLGGLALLRRRR